MQLWVTCSFDMNPPPVYSMGPDRGQTRIPVYRLKSRKEDHPLIEDEWRWEPFIHKSSTCSDGKDPLPTFSLSDLFDSHKFRFFDMCKDLSFQWNDPV